MKLFLFTLPLLASAILSGCTCQEDAPLLSGRISDGTHQTPINITLHQNEDEKTYEIIADEHHLFSFSPQLESDRAEITFRHGKRKYGALLEKSKHVEIDFIPGDIEYKGDNKEINNFCCVFHQIYDKENFHCDRCSDETVAYLRDRLAKGTLLVRQQLATVTDNELRELMSARVETVAEAFGRAIKILDATGDISLYTQALEGVDLHHNLFTGNINMPIDHYVNAINQH